MENQDNLKQSIYVIYDKLTKDLPDGCTRSPYGTSPLNRMNIITNDHNLATLFRSCKIECQHVDNNVNIVTMGDIVKSAKLAVSGTSGHDNLISFTKNIRIALFNYNAHYLAYGIIRLNTIRIEFSCYVSGNKLPCVCYIPFTALCNQNAFEKYVLHVLSSDFSILPDYIEDCSIRGFVVDLSDNKTNLHCAYNQIKDYQDKNLKKFVSYKSDVEVIIWGDVAGKYLNTLDDTIIVDCLKLYILLVLWNKDRFAERYLSELINKYTIDEKLLTVLSQYTNTVDKDDERKSLCKFFQYSLAKEIPSYSDPNDDIYTDVWLLIENLPLRTWGGNYFICDDAYNFYHEVLSKYIGKSDIDYCDS